MLDTALNFQLLDLKGDGAFEATAFPGERVEIAPSVRGFVAGKGGNGDDIRYFDIRDARSRIDVPMVSKAAAAAEAIQGTVLDPSGRPSANVEVGLVLDKETADIIDKDIFLSAIRPITRTDKDGRFHLPKVSGKAWIEAAGKEGYCEIDAHAASHVMTLKPWGRVEGRYAPGGMAPGKRSVSGDFTRYAEGLPKIRFTPRTICDTEGNFLLDCVPEGIVSLEVRYDTDPVSYPAQLTRNVAVEWGRTTKVDAAAPICTVTGRLEIPSAMAGKLDYDGSESYIDRKVDSTFIMPPGATSDACDIARQRFDETPAGREEALARTYYGLRFGHDGTFTMRGLPPGDYELMINLPWKMEGSLRDNAARGGRNFHVAPGQPSMDLGSIALRMGVPPLQVGDPVPKFDLPASDGTRVNSDALKGKIVVIQFSQGDDKWSAENDSYFADVRKAVSDAPGVEYLSFNTAESKEVFQKLRGVPGGPWRNCYIGTASNSPVLQAFRTNGGWPIEMVVGADGKLAYMGFNYGEAAVAARGEVGKRTALPVTR